jgi:hypothetical protein
MLNAARPTVGKPTDQELRNGVPVLASQRRLPAVESRELASRLRDINVRIVPANVLPKDFGKGVLFWRSESMQLMPNFRKSYLPDAQDGASLSVLKTHYGEAATGSYEKARRLAAPFADLDRGLAQLNHHFNPYKVTEIRAQLAQALKQDPQFAEAWILLARTLKRGESSLVLGDKPVPAKFLQSMAAIMTNPYDPNLVMQLNSALPAPTELPAFLNNRGSSGYTLPLTKARLALYTLRHLDPGHASALGALIESGEAIKMRQLLPVRRNIGRTDINQAELGAMAMIQYDWQTGFLALLHAREHHAPDDAIFTPGGGAVVTAKQLEILINLETEERDPNAGPSYDRESGQSLLDRDRARAQLLDSLAETVSGPDSWFYIPGYMLMNQKQLQALARVFRAERGAFDRLREVITEWTPLPVPTNQTAGVGGSGSDRRSASSSGSDSMMQDEPIASDEEQALLRSGAETAGEHSYVETPLGPAPVPNYRNTEITHEWIDAHQKLVEGRSDPALFRQLAAQAKESPLGFVSVMGQAFRARDLELRADLLENNQKPAAQQSAAPVFRLYLDQAKEIANNTVRNPAFIKQQPFVLKLSNQRGHPLADLLSQLPITWGRPGLERSLVSALKTFMREFDETRTAPFRTLTESERWEDSDFKHALAVVDLMADMPKRFQALRAQYAEQREQAQQLAQEQGISVPESVSLVQFPDQPVFTAPDRCPCCLESSDTEEDPLLTIPFDPGAHRSCLAEKMIITGRPDLKGAWDDAPALSFIEWADQANQAIKGYRDFVRAHQTPAPARPPIPPRAPIIRESSQPLGAQEIDQWVDEQLEDSRSDESAVGRDFAVDWGTGELSHGAGGAVVDQQQPSDGDLEAPYDELAIGSESATDSEVDVPGAQPDQESAGLESPPGFWGWDDDDVSIDQSSRSSSASA